MGRHQYLNEDEYEVNLKDFEPQPGELLNNLTILTRWSCSASCTMWLSLTQDAERNCSLYMKYIICSN